MLRVQCPACGHRRKVSRDRLGTVQPCRRCGGRFVPRKPALDFLSDSNVAGQRVGVVLLLMAVLLFAHPALGFLLRGPSALQESDERTALFAAAATGSVGVLLVVRHRRAVRRDEYERIEAMRRDSEQFNRFEAPPSTSSTRPA